MKETPWLNETNQLTYLSPLYLPEGDGTEIMDAAGHHFYDPRSIRSIKKLICRHFTLDYQALRLRFQQRGGSGPTPLTLAPDYTLVAVKTRTARCPGDPCYGLVNLNMIESVEKYAREGARSKVIFQSGSELLSVSTVKTVQNSLLLARSMGTKATMLPADVTLIELLIRFLRLYEQEKKGL